MCTHLMKPCLHLVSPKCENSTILHLFLLSSLMITRGINFILLSYIL